MVRRVFVSGLWHETNTFAPVTTGLADFRAYQLLEADAMAGALGGTNTEVGGMLEAAPALDLTPALGLFAGAVPAGRVTGEAYRQLVAATLRRADAAKPLDGVLLALHGAMVAEGAEDGDGALATRLRDVLGPNTPMVATFDIHANLSPALFEACDLLIGYDTYPHTDMAVRGREAAGLLARMLQSGARPARAIRKLPLLTVPQVQGTDDLPMRAVIGELHQIEARPGIWSASVAVGFPYADVAHLGVTVLAYGDDQGAVDKAAADLARAVWRRRHGFVPHLVPVGEAVRSAMAAREGPVVLVDVADNVGGGAPGDGTAILRELLARKVSGAVVVMWAPEAARRCVELAPGARFHGRIGASGDRREEGPVEIDGVIELARPVDYQRQSSYMTGQRVSLGRVGVVQAAGVRVVLTERRVMPFDADHLRVLGIEPAAQKILVCKSAIAWRAAFGDVARAHVFVDTPGVCASDLGRFTYTRGGQAMFPLNPDARWPASDA